ncbi:MAG TPA: hypothetical protein VN874_05290 [Myxococcales bacterium]|jgi:hypothetical protein|nr:hypothetical protein [Myxococcales bacterium]
MTASSRRAVLALVFALQLGAGARAADDKPADAGAEAAAAPTPLPGAPKEPAELRVRITVRAIAASREAQAPEVDPRLAPIAADLHSFASDFNFKGYRLVEEQTFDLDWKSPAQMELPGSRSVQVTPRGLGADGRIKVHLEVLGQHPEHARRLHTDYSVPRGRTILVGGYKLDPAKPDGGTLLIAVTQAVK